MSRILTIDSNIVTIAGNAASLSTNAPLQMKLVATLAACSVFSMQNGISYCFVPTTNVTEFWALGTTGQFPTTRLQGPFYGTIFGVGGTAEGYAGIPNQNSASLTACMTSNIHDGSLHGIVLNNGTFSQLGHYDFTHYYADYINVSLVNGGASVYQIITK